MRISPFTVSQAALVKRINRKLAHDGEYLRTPRGERGRHDLGQYYIANDRNCIVAMHVDPVVLGRQLHALSEHETIGSDDQGARS